VVWWKGTAIDRQSDEYMQFVRRAYQAMFDQNERFRTALMSTRGMTLYHSRGESNPFKTILIESELCQILTDMRDNYDKRDKGIEKPKRVLVETDGLSLEMTVHKGQVCDFEGERIELGSEKFPDWNSVLIYLMNIEQ
jgi:hypothetical protein